MRFILCYNKRKRIFFYERGIIMKRKTKNQIKYEKEMKRINALFKRLASEGWKVESVKSIIPPKPQRITLQFLNKLSRIKPDTIRRRTTQLTNKGERSYQEFYKERKRKRSEAAKNRERIKKAKNQQLTDNIKKKASTAEEEFRKQQETLDNVVDEDLVAALSYQPDDMSPYIIANFLENCKHFPKYAYPIISDWISRLRKEVGDPAVAAMIQMANANGYQLTAEIAYDSTLLKSWMTDVLDFLDVPPITKSAMEDLVEEGEFFSSFNTARHVR